MASRYNSHDSPTITAGAVVAMSATLIAVVKVSALYSKWYKKFIVSEPISTSLSQLRRTKSRRASTCGNAQGLNAMTPINQDQKTSAAGGTPVTRVLETTLLLAQKPHREQQQYVRRDDRTVAWSWNQRSLLWKRWRGVRITSSPCRRVLDDDSSLAAG